MKMVLNVGAVICGLIGLWAVYVGIVNFWKLPYPSWNITVLLFQVVFIALAFTPGFMLSRGIKIKRWQLAVISVSELIVVGLGLLAILTAAALFEFSAMH